MANRRFALILLWSIPIVLILLNILYLPRLPEMVAVHFNAAGSADSFWKKNSAFEFQVIFIIGLTLLMWGLSILVYKLPEKALNLPNRDYWLAPERKRQTLDDISTFILWMGVLTNAFLFSLFYYTMKTNIEREFQLGATFWLFFLFYMGTTTWLIVKFSKKFLSKKSNEK